MPSYFLDTSAVAKLYRQEAGSGFVDRLFAEPGGQRIISYLAIVEMESVFALEVRIGAIGLQADLARRRLLVAELEGFSVTNPEQPASPTI